MDSHFTGPLIFCSGFIPILSLGVPPTLQQTDETSNPLFSKMSVSIRASFLKPEQKAMPNL
jgi:hypothetical protein